MVAQVFHIIGHAAISQVQIVGLCRILGCQGIDLFHHRKNSHLLAMITHIQDTVFHITLVANGTGYLEIGESLHFRLAEQFVRHIGNLLVVIAPFVHLFRSVHDVLQFLQEPFVNLGQLMNLVYRVTCTHGFADHEDALVRRLSKGFVHILYNQFLILYEAMHSLANHAQTFLNGFLESTSDGHHLAHRFHGRAQLTVHTMELAQVPTGNLAHHIVQCRFEECAGGLCHRVFQVEQPVSQA